MNPRPPQFAAILLAGGASSRMGRPKALLPFGGQTFLDRLIGIFAEHCSPVVAVLGYDAPAIAAQLARAHQATLVTNPHPELGQLFSLQCGLRALAAPLDAVFFHPVDAPGLAPGTLAALAAAWSPAHDFVIPIHAGRRGHPVACRFDLISEFLALAASATARDVVHRHRDRTLYVEIADPAVLQDIDTPSAFNAIQQGRS